MFYDRKVKYLNYYQNGERIKGSGFIRLEVREGTLKIEMKVTGLHPTDTFERDVLICGEGREKTIGRMALKSGAGEYLYLCREPEDIGGTGIGYGELRGIRIPLGAGREIVCNWKESGKATDKEPGNTMTESERQRKPERAETGRKREPERTESERQREPGRTESERQREPEKEETGRKREAEAVRGRAEYEREDRRPEISRSEPGSRSGVESSFAGEAEKAGGQNSGSRFGETHASAFTAVSRSDAGKPSAGYVNYDMTDMTEDADRNIRTEDTGRNVRTGRKETPGGAGRTETAWEAGGTGRGGKEGHDGDGKAATLLEDKWMQLWAIYPHIRPFRDEREFLSIRPADFVLFPAESYRQVNNSFLLHGYYNYHHLILTKAERRGETLYYIGVPGNYFEREKQVAVMFGFESFECAEEPAQAGDFGYYMMRTGL